MEVADSASDRRLVLTVRRDMERIRFDSWFRVDNAAAGRARAEHNQKLVPARLQLGTARREAEVAAAADCSNIPYRSYLRLLFLGAP
jgi:hypothetical protein